MKRASENQRNDGVMSDHCYPGCKVKDLLLRQESQSQNILDTVMRPSQIPNRYPPPPLRRSLQFQSPDQNHGQRQCFNMPPPHPPHPPQPPQPPGPNRSIGFGHYNLINGGNLANQQTLPPVWHYSPQPQQFNSVGPVYNTPVPMSPQFHHTPVKGYTLYSNFTPDVRSWFSHSQRDRRVKPSDTVSNQECINPPGQDQNKVESTPERSVSLVEQPTPCLHPPESQSVKESVPLKMSSPQTLESRSLNNSVPLKRSESWSPQSASSVGEGGRRVSFTITTNTTTSSQKQVHEGTLPSEKFHTDIVNHVLQKRRRESGGDDDHAKKQCVQTLGSDRKDNTGHMLSSSSSQKHQVLELSPKTTENLLRTDSPPSKPTAPIRSVLKPCGSPMGVKQACIKSMHADMVILNSPPRKCVLLSKAHEESKKKDNTSSTLLTSPLKKVSVPANNHTTPNRPRCLSKVDENKTPQKTVIGSPGYSKLHRPKKPDDLTDLFIPDPLTYKVNSWQKTLEVRHEEKAKSNISNKGDSVCISSNTETPVAKPCHKDTSSTSTFSSNTLNTSVNNTPHSDDIQISLPKVSLTRIPLDDLPDSCKITATKSVMASPEKQEKQKGQGTSCTKETDSVDTPKKMATSPTRTVKQSEDNDDSLDLELDLNFDSIDLDATKSSHSSDDEEQLVSLQEMMTRKSKPPDTPEKGAFSEPSSPGHTHHKRHHHVVSNNNSASYKNSLDQMLKEISTSKKAKEMETQLLTACQEDLLRLAEYEKAEEDAEEPILPEQQRFLQRFSLMSSAIKEVPPGHVVFNLEKFGRIFDQNTLQLRQCLLSPEKTEQKTLLWSSHAQLKLHINIGLFQEAYSYSPCPVQVTRFLFKMMSVHSERLLSDKILQVLCDIAFVAASQRVNKSNLAFKVWVPTVADLTLVFLNMGVPFVSLFPLENLQPPFTEGDLLENVHIKSDNPSTQEPVAFPEHNCNNIFKYLSYCARLRPRAYTDSELLLLVTVSGTVSLESRLILQTTVSLDPLLFKIINNIRDWDNMMPKLCQALTDLTDDHHNMCHLVQLLPNHFRGRILRQHLSLSMISKLLDGSCLYKPRHKDIQLYNLRLFVSRMKPSSLLRIVSSSHALTDEEDMSTLDQQAYYLCYSLLTLVNEVTNFQSFPAHQEEHLMLLCSELERHVKCHIRESEKCLYRTKVKDLVARIYTKWQMLLQRTRPLNGKLYHYWQPSQEDVTSSQDIEEIESSQEFAEKEVVETGAEMEDGEEDEVTVVEMTQNAPKKDNNSSMGETSLTNAAKEVTCQSTHGDVTACKDIEEIGSNQETAEKAGTEISMEESSLKNAAKGVVDKEVIREATEEARCDEKNDTQDEEMDCEGGELEQLMHNATEDAVKEDEAISTLETSIEDMMQDVGTTQEILIEDTDTTIDSSFISNSTETNPSSPILLISIAHFTKPKYYTENS